ncbi:hypothetical protein CISG_05725 [Coccidioides immitis RMSCC 3703]|uniref:Uncharacterized protein n=1 Tax=Coccidioides immitis RMSCC 3703 TaxID=454286 RepID=A0A0J8TS67_COCIT|nr:hypothetical protein CISG_05725 [Coccidioides immitis RMSCC 3703]
MLAAKGKELLVVVRVGSDRGYTAIGFILEHVSVKNIGLHDCGHVSDNILAMFLRLLRFIPNREGQDLQASYSLLHEDGCPSTPSKGKRRPPHGEIHFQKSKGAVCNLNEGILSDKPVVAEEANRTYSRVLRNEFFGDTVPQSDLHTLSPERASNSLDPTRSHTPPSHKAASSLPPASITPSTPSKNLFSYSSPRKVSGNPTPSRTPHSGSNFNAHSDIYSLSPIRFDSQRILQSLRKQPRYVNKVPFQSPGCSRFGR